MTKQRPYSDAITVAEALDELRRCSGSQFDPRCVRAFCELIEHPEQGLGAADPAPTGSRSGYRFPLP